VWRDRKRSHIHFRGRVSGRWAIAWLGRLVLACVGSGAILGIPDHRVVPGRFGRTGKPRERLRLSRCLTVCLGHSIDIVEQARTLILGGLDDLFDREDDLDAFEDLLSVCGSSCSCSPRGTRRDHAKRAPARNLGPSILSASPTGSGALVMGPSGSSSFSSSRRTYQTLLIIDVYGRLV
jgi:hypothetical protein